MRQHLITHKGCPDGHASFLLAADTMRENEHEFVHTPMSYGDPLPDVDRGDLVMCIDFCPTGPELRELADKTNALIVLDHHQSAYGYVEDAGIHLFNSVDEALDVRVDDLPEHFAILDMDHSGAGLAREWFGWSETSKEWQVLKYVQDRDLWRFEFPETKDVFAALTAFPYEEDAWWEAISEGVERLVGQGKAINRYRDQLIALAVESAFDINIPGLGKTSIAHSLYATGPDVAGILANAYQHGVGAYVVVQADGMKLGLRSTPDGADVAELAAQLQPGRGGGHKHAAGCLISFEEFAKWLS